LIWLEISDGPVSGWVCYFLTRNKKFENLRFLGDIFQIQRWLTRPNPSIKKMTRPGSNHLQELHWKWMKNYEFLNLLIEISAFRRKWLFLSKTSFGLFTMILKVWRKALVSANKSIHFFIFTPKNEINDL